MTKEPKQLSVPQNILDCIPYPPGKPIEETERELGIPDIIKLASNENPLGASPKAVEALKKEAAKLHRYPDANHFYLSQAIAELNDVSPDSVLIGNGSNEIIDILVRTYCQPGDNVISCAHAFVAYRVCAQVHGIEYREAKTNSQLVADVHSMAQQIDQNTKIIFLPNPNNPTGTYITKEEIHFLLKSITNSGILLVLDSAYHEYVDAEDYPNALDVLQNWHNVVVMRTFSKIHGLAGLRIGYGLAHPKILKPMRTVKMPFNVNSYGQAAALAALNDHEHIEKSLFCNRTGKMFLSQKFQALGLRTWPSQGNFILVDIRTEPRKVFDSLLKLGVIVRPVIGYGLRTHLRVSIGTASENDRLVRCLEQVLGSGIKNSNL